MIDDDKCVCCGEYTKDGMVCNRCASKGIVEYHRSVLESGVYLRAQRNGKWQSLDLVELTDFELSEWLKTLSSDGLIRLVIHLINEMRRQT